MANCLAREEEPFRSTQQTVFPGQVSKVAGAVKKFCRSNSFRDIQGESAMGGGYFARCAFGHVTLHLLVVTENDLKLFFKSVEWAKMEHVSRY